MIIVLILMCLKKIKIHNKTVIITTISLSTVSVTLCGYMRIADTVDMKKIIKNIY